MKTGLSIAMLIGLAVVPASALAQDAAAAPQQPAATAPATPPARGARPPAPTRDPQTPGYVAATMLPDGAVPPADAVGNFVIGDAQGSQRGLEYDTMSGRYAEFVETEVLPLVEKQYKVHCDRTAKAQTLPNALEFVWKDYPITRKLSK